MYAMDHSTSDDFIDGVGRMKPYAVNPALSRLHRQKKSLLYNLLKTFFTVLFVRRHPHHPHRPHLPRRPRPILKGRNAS